MKPIIVLPAILSMALGFSSQVSAFTCFLTLVKDSCWTDYDVTVNMGDATTGKPVLTLSVPKGKSFSRQEFTCNAGQVFNYKASFSPIFWQADKGKIFPGKRTWSLPDTIKKGDTAWNITICYPSEFSEIPLPPTATANCKCDTQNLPPVPAPAKP